MIFIPIENQHAYHTIPRNKDLRARISNHCDNPSRVLVVDWKGDCFVCTCEAWLPVSVGKISDFMRLGDVWAASSARSLQQDIDHGLFTHCAVDRCGIMDHSHVNQCFQISINIDESCNLACPSCRSGPIMLTAGPEFEKKLDLVNHLVTLLEQFDSPCRVIMSGNGDPLASAIMRPLIHRWQPRVDHSIRLFTNGLLLKKQLLDSPIRPHVQEYFISIDAGSKDVYERVRLGGSWRHLIENFDWLAANVPDRSSVLLMMVLQRENYLDIKNFCRLVTDYGFRGSITYLEDWGTWQDFLQQDVIGNQAHSEHARALGELAAAHALYQDHAISFGSKLLQLIHDQ